MESEDRLAGGLTDGASATGGEQPVIDVSRLVARAAGSNPEMVAVVEAQGRALTWEGLEAEVAAVASGYATLGVVGGYRVMIAVGNRIDFIGAYLGALRAHAVAVPVNPGSTTDELTRMLDDSGARIVVADAESLDRVREAVAASRVDARVVRAGDAGKDAVGGPNATAGEVTYQALASASPREMPERLDPESLAVLLYTSGTSGRPRGVMLSHRALLANIEQVARVEPPMMTGDDVVLGVLPLFHVYGLNAVLGGVLRHRAKLLLVERFHPTEVLDLIDDEAISVIPVAPPVFAAWLPADGLAERLGPVRLVLSGSAPLPAETIAEFTRQTGLGVHQGYGLTEAAPVVTSTLCSSDPAPGSVGAAIPGIEMRLVDEGGHAPEVSDPGRVEIRGDNLFSGYWPDGAEGPATEADVTDPDDVGWWDTGDVGFLDENGDLFLVDRSRELIIVSGFNVYPMEIEDVIGEVPGVRAVGVVGQPDELQGESVVAFVQGAPDADREALADAVREHAGRRLARFKQPSAVHVVDDLPLTVTGKVQKGRLRAATRRAHFRPLGES